MLSSKRSLCQAVMLAFSLCIGSAAHAQTAAKPPAIESFFQRPVFGDVELSPSAKYLAVRASAPERNDYLVVIDLATNTPTVVAAYNDSDIAAFQWVNDERLVFNVTDKSQGPGNTRHAPGLFAVNRDGSRLDQLVDRQWGTASKAELIGRKMLPWNTYLMAQPAGNSEYIYVGSPVYDSKQEVRHVNLLRLNTLTGHAQAVPRPGPFKNWILDHKGEPRLAMTHENGTSAIFYLDPATAAWRQIASFPTYAEGKDQITPVGFGPDGTLYVTSNNGKDTTALYTFNFATGKINPDPLVVTTGYDFAGGLVRNRDKVLGVAFTTDATANEWFDPGMKALQQTLDKLLPTTVNLISVPNAPESPWVLVVSYSDAVPYIYNLYNTKTGVFNNVGSAYPAIKPAQMGRQQAVSYKARDGMTIPALLTLPRAATKGKNLPLVVLVHGGPYVKGNTWSWHPESQFLASRGYAVLEPSFRGTTGLGQKHFRAGWKQWGLEMQNDIAEGARWAIAQGIADPKRICIAGASYGGYATLMGLVNDPDLYKCGVNWVGVTDINLMYGDSWTYTSDMGDDWKKYGMPELVGDQVKDAAQLKATSPIEQAARIKQPLLMAYGGVDRRVPMHHGKKFLEAVRRTNQNVEWIEYPEEAHGWYLPKNSIDFWTRVEKFLDKNIGAGAVKAE
jgi:dipeptidyl aminopeptidase/acylaminoacyl peptidase